MAWDAVREQNKWSSQLLWEYELLSLSSILQYQFSFCKNLCSGTLLIITVEPWPFVLAVTCFIVNGLQRYVSAFIVDFFPRHERKLTLQRADFSFFHLLLYLPSNGSIMILKGVPQLSEKRIIYSGLANIFIDCYIQETCFRHLMDLWAFASLLLVTGNQIVKQKTLPLNRVADEDVCSQFPLP